MNPRFLLPTILGCTLVTATATEYNLLSAAAPAKALVPSAANGGNVAGFVWQAEADPANITAWTGGNTGVGFDTDTSGGGNFNLQIGINVQSAMSGINPSVFIRVPFNVNASDLPLFRSLTLRMRYDDGFVAWINGTKVTSALEPATLSWNSATLNNGAHNADVTAWDDFDISQHLPLLHAGSNILAIQGMNSSAGSSDVLIHPVLVASDIPPVRWPVPVFTEVPGVGARTRPIAVRNAGDGSNKLYIAEQSGIIYQLSNGVLTSFMDISGRVLGNNDSGGGNEQGLFGIAFPPNFAQSRRFYVSYSGTGGTLTLSRFRTLTANPAAGDPASEQILQTINHSANSNHNGSDIHFGRDGYLYYSTGDGGGGGDTPNNAQNPAILLGKMLRLDVEGNAGGGSLIPASNPWAAAGDGVMDQIYHIGLRNPWRWSFDRLTGDMWIGDVGQDVSYEEVDFIPGNTPGRNFQWRRREGLHDYNTANAYGPGTLTEPILEKSGADFSITGGYVYRGRAFPRMNGIYFYGDYGSGNFYGVQKDGSGVWRSATLRTDAGGVTTFGEDEAGELYMATNRVYRITDSGSDFAYLNIVSNTVDPNGRVTFTWGAANGRGYVPEVSTNMVDWTPAGPSQTGTGTFRLTFTEASDPPAGTGRRYFRAREL